MHVAVSLLQNQLFITAYLSGRGWREQAACDNLMFRRFSNACEPKWSMVSRYQLFKPIMYWYPCTSGCEPRPFAPVPSVLLQAAPVAANQSMRPATEQRPHFCSDSSELLRAGCA